MAVVTTTPDTPIHTIVACQKGHMKGSVIFRCKHCIYYTRLQPAIWEVEKIIDNYQSTASSSGASSVQCTCFWEMVNLILLTWSLITNY